MPEISHADAQVIWTTNTAMEAAQILILAEAGTNPAVDAGLRARLIASCNARAFKWAHADQAGIHHMTTRDRLHPTVTRSGLITWQQVWDRIGRGITPDRTAELRAVLATLDAWDGPQGMDWMRARARLNLAERAFFQPVPAPVQLDLLDLFAGVSARG